jgi:nucleotide-binding universal stress UspA family protein
MFKRILVAIDVNRALIERALVLSNGQADSIELIHVINELPMYVAAQIPQEIYQQSHKAAQDTLDSLIENTQSDLPLTATIVSGKPWYQIVRAAQKSSADLIVLAAHDPSIADVFLGSVANQVVRHAGCSVYLHREIAAVAT